MTTSAKYIIIKKSTQHQRYFSLFSTNMLRKLINFACYQQVVNNYRKSLHINCKGC